MDKLKDTYSRVIDYLRISVTDRCNLRCVYCMPAEGIKLLSHDEVLRYEEILEIVKVAAGVGIHKIRLTGGEPLVRAGLPGFVASLAAIEGIDDITMTTNGILLKQYAAALKEAGLHRVNISLDSLKPEKFARITRYDRFKEVMESIEAAREAGLNPVKINVVAMSGVNDDELVDFARKTITDGWNVRFIEMMPFVDGLTTECRGGAQTEELHPQYMSVKEIKDKLDPLGHFNPVHLVPGNGPARYYRFDNAAGTVGFISPVSEHFCFKCNRLRLTADGKLRPCLLSDVEVDLRPHLRSGQREDKIKKAIARAIELKPKQHHLAEGAMPHNRHMSQVGG